MEVSSHRLSLFLTRAEKLGLGRVLEILHTCDWTSPTIDTDSLGSLQDPELDFELNAFDDGEDEDDQNQEKGSEKDVDYMERMMAMLLHARGMVQFPVILCICMDRLMSRNGPGNGIGGTETVCSADD
jgi:hypothetical protein